MKISLFGSCRLLCINKYFQCTGLNESISYTHTTGEAIQLAKFINGNIEIPEEVRKYCFRTGIIHNKLITYTKEFQKEFQETDLFVIEVCSIKNYMYNDFHIHHLAVDKRLNYYQNTPKEITCNTRIVRQKESDIEKDLLKINNMIGNKKILIVSHINAMANKNIIINYYKQLQNLSGKIKAIGDDQTIDTSNNFFTKKIHIAKRAALIKSLSAITKKLNMHFLDPSIILTKFPQHKILVEEKFGSPPGHYTEFGQEQAGKLFFEKITNIMSQ